MCDHLPANPTAPVHCVCRPATLRCDGAGGQGAFPEERQSRGQGDWGEAADRQGGVLYTQIVLGQGILMQGQGILPALPAIPLCSGEWNEVVLFLIADGKVQGDGVCRPCGRQGPLPGA